MRATPIGVNLSRHRPPARGGPTIYDGSTSDTNAAYYSRATPCGLTRGGFLGKFVVKSLERPTERVALGTLLHRLPRPIHPKPSPCKPLAGGLPGAASVACPVRRRWPVRCSVGDLSGAALVTCPVRRGWPVRSGVGGLWGDRTGFRERFWGWPG